MITAGFLEVPAIGNEPATSAEIFLFPETKRRKKLRSFGPSVTIGPEAAKRNHGSDSHHGANLPSGRRAARAVPRGSGRAALALQSPPRSSRQRPDVTAT